MQDGIEIHFNEKRGFLELACEPHAFNAYREIARAHLKGFPEIPLEKIVEISVINTALLPAGQSRPKSRVLHTAVALLAVIVLSLVLIGAYAVFIKIMS